MESVFRVFKVYGFNGGRQKESFSPSCHFTTWNGEIVTVCNSDMTGTHEYCIIAITAESDERVKACLKGQLSDGIFENCRYGKIEELI